MCFYFWRGVPIYITVEIKKIQEVSCFQSLKDKLPEKFNKHYYFIVCCATVRQYEYWSNDAYEYQAMTLE